MAHPRIPNTFSVIFCTITMHNNDEFFIEAVMPMKMVNFSEIVHLDR
jgi:hypothetical protein